MLDPHRLEAALQRPLTGAGEVELFRTIFERAAALGHSLATTHPFVDGNKRTAFGAATVLLRANGLALNVSDEDAENTMVALALGDLDLPGFAQWLERHAVALAQ